jgi:hypothetical protein
MAGSGRVSVTVDGNKFDAITVNFNITTQKDQAGMPILQTLNTKACVWVDAHDNKNLPFGTFSKLFELANVPDNNKLKDVKIEYWLDDQKKDALCTYKFKGWISKFSTYNPPVVQGASSGGSNIQANWENQFNNILYLELEPIINKSSQSEVLIGN